MPKQQILVTEQQGKAIAGREWSDVTIDIHPGSHPEFLDVEVDTRGIAIAVQITRAAAALLRDALTAELANH